MLSRPSLFAVTCLAALLCAGAQPSPAADAVAPAFLRVLTYNIHHGAGEDGKIDLDRIARVIRDSGADLVVLQEVDRGTRRSGKVDQAKSLADRLKMHHAFGTAIRFEGGEYGNAVLSRWPLAGEKVEPLPNPGKKEARAAVVATADVPGVGPVGVVGTHLSHDSADSRAAQAAAVGELAVKLDAKLVVLAGDFNAPPADPTLRPLTERWHDPAAGAAKPVLTYPADKPKARIDYVLIRKADAAAWDATARAVEEPVASDHRPVLVTLRRK
ncbi:MAG TPA: endonuclease/exonuclease/phosphatase family protein, partial [Humisphaera sp.]